MCALGAASGFAVAGLRALRRSSSLSPFGIVLGGTAGITIWLLQALPARLSSGMLLAQMASGLLLGCLGALAGQFARRKLARRIRIEPKAARDLAIASLMILPAFLPGPARRPENPPKNLLLLTIDTLRADRLGLSGFPRPTSPNLDRLARRGSTALRAVSPLPRTLPALASLMTGTLPHVHGVRDNFHYALGSEARTLASQLREAGYATAAVNSNPVLAHDSGIYRGFESACDRGDDWSRLAILRLIQRVTTLLSMRAGDRDQVITSLALDWLRARPKDRSFFLWVHWLAPHIPYEPASPYDRLFDPGYDGEYQKSFDYSRISKGEMTYRNPLSPRTLEHAKNLYDAEVATVDRALGRLLREMEMAGDLENTVIVLTADHGESLDEHGYFFNHGDFVYGPATNVPVVWRGIDGLSGIEERPTSLERLAPAILGHLGVPHSGAGKEEPLFFGESDFCRFPDLNTKLGWLLPVEIAQNPDRIPDWRERWEEQALRAKQRFVEADRWKLVLSPRPEGDAIELFDLNADPGETANVAPRYPQVASALQARLEAWIAETKETSGVAPERTIDEALRAQLQALGYLGD
jgi:arylsulfatase A-like enzyme